MLLIVDNNIFENNFVVLQFSYVGIESDCRWDRKVLKLRLMRLVKVAGIRWIIVRCRHFWRVHRPQEGTFSNELINDDD